MIDIFNTLIEVKLKNPEDFLKVKETLSRIGVSSYNEKRLAQTCHIFHRKGQYYIVHFLEMFKIDGKGKTFTEEDKNRRDTIALLLEEWGLVEIVNRDILKGVQPSMKGIKIVPFKEKNEWVLVPKYHIGRK